MNIKIYNKIKFLSDVMPISFYTGVTRQKMIFPFYHAVSNTPKPHLKHLDYYRTKDCFERDLDFFLKYYDNIPIEKINKTDKMSFFISFDDGLSEVYNEVIPLLKRKKIDAAFFINTDFVDNKKLFYRHKISLIIDCVSKSNHSLKVAANFLSCNEDDIFDKIDNIKDENLINQIAVHLKLDFEEYLNDVKPYLTTKQLIEMKRMGFTIGNHSKSHINFKNLLLEEQKIQVSAVNNFLNQKLNIENLYFSFPFGDYNIKNDFFEYLYNIEKVEYSFGISGIKKDGFTRHIHRIPMEYNGFSAEQIIKYEYFYFMIKAFFNRNKIKR